MLATAVAMLPTGPGWAYEFKWDGVRVLLDTAGAGAGRATLTSRAGNDVTAGYPELRPAVAADALLDGEVVAFVDGRPSFEALQARMHVRGRSEVAALAVGTPVNYVVFDLLRLDGTDLLDRPLQERRAALDAWLGEHPQPGWSASPVFDDADATEQVARAQRLEGVVAKRSASRYRPGQRSPDWAKLRFTRSGDFVVVGWEAAAEFPDRLSSLVLARSTPAGLRFAGKVGSGLTARSAAALQRRLVPVPRCPLDETPPPGPGRRPVQWVRPEHVVQVTYTDVTGDGRLRQPVFERDRPDKSADEAIGEADGDA